MLTRTITTLAKSNLVPDWWKPLFAATARSSIFIGAEWMQNWLDIYGAEFEGQWIHWDQAGVVVGGCLVLTREVRKGILSLRSVYFNATGISVERTPFAEFNDVLFLTQFRSEIAADLADFLKSRQWDRVFVSGYERGGVLDELCSVLPSASVERKTQTAAYVDLVALKDVTLESSLSSNTRSQFRRSVMRYEEQYGSLQLRRAASKHEALTYLEQLAIWHNERRGSKGESGSFESHSILKFHQRLIEVLFASGEVDLLRLDAGETPVGYLYNFLQHGKVYFFQSGFRYENDSKMKPGLLTHALAIQRYIADGLHEYDFLAGDSQYKRSFAKQARMLDWSVVYRNNTRVKMLLTMRKIAYRFRGLDG